MRRNLQTLVTFAALAVPVLDVAFAQGSGGEPGDYGFRHERYHDEGLVAELERKVGHSCCDDIGECRASYVDLKARKAFVDGRWCPIGHRTSIRTDIVLPDRFALVCAGKSQSRGNPCPPIFCLAIAPGI